MGRAATLAALCLAVYLAGALASLWNCDDSFIAFRYSRHLAEGQGLRYNLGVEPPVEGYTQLGWVLWIGLWEALDVDPVPASRATGLVAGALLLLALLGTARRRLGDDPLALLAVGLFFATAPGVLVWSSGGLGTMPFALAVFLLWERLLGDPERVHLKGAVLAGLAVVLLRADGPYWVAVTGVLAMLQGRRRERPELFRAGFSMSLVVATGFLALVAFRVAYHGDWIPNTARNKVGLTAVTAWRGTQYVLHNLASTPSAALLLLAVPWVTRGPRCAWLRTAWWLTVATFAYGVLVGGDFMAFGRFFVPTWAWLALGLGRLVQAARARGAGLATGVLALALLGTAPARYDVPLTPRALREAVQFRWGREYESEFVFWQGMQDRAGTWIELGKALALHTTPDESLVRGAIGAVGYHSRLFIFDRLGLVNRDVVARVEIDPDERRLPGHDRNAPRGFFAEWEPTYRRARLTFGVATLPDGTRVPLDEEDRPTARGEERHEVHARDGFRDDGFLHLYRY